MIFKVYSVNKETGMEVVYSTQVHVKAVWAGAKTARLYFTDGSQSEEVVYPDTFTRCELVAGDQP